MKQTFNRIIGRKSGLTTDPLLILLGGIHGNEPAGIHAINSVMTMLDFEPIVNPDFTYRGTLLGICANPPAVKKQVRYIDRDMNRSWLKDKIDVWKKEDPDTITNEELQVVKTVELIEKEVEKINPSHLYLLDLHTTTAFGGIFSLVSDDNEGMHIAAELHAPVVKGLVQGLKGTSVQFFNKYDFGIPSTAIGFESGQHNERLSINRAIAAIINCMRTIGMIEEEYVENKHDALLLEHSRGLPQISKLAYKHDVNGSDKFCMKPGVRNFTPVERGDVLANDKNGEVRAPVSGMILMPLYQEQGDDGFFIISEEKPPPKNHKIPVQNTTIAAKDIDEAIQRIESEEYRDQLLRYISENQPDLLAYLTQEAFDLLSEEELELYSFGWLVISDIIINVFGKEQKRISHKTIGELEEKNWSVWERQYGKTLHAKADPYFYTCPHEEVLAFMEDMLSHYDFKESRDPVSWIWIGWKTCLDTYSIAVKHSS